MTRYESCMRQLHKAKNIHGDKYDYSKWVETFSKVANKVTVICRKHGEFEIRVLNHVHGNGCKKCGAEARTKRLTTPYQEFVDRAKDVHGDKYDYDENSYIMMSEKVRVRCGTHGWFKQTATQHVRGHGCNLCAIDVRALNSITPFPVALEKMRRVHGNRYEYDESSYTKMISQMRICCDNHGWFNLTPSRHCLGFGCPECMI